MFVVLFLSMELNKINLFLSRCCCLCLKAAMREYAAGVLAKMKWAADVLDAIVVSVKLDFKLISRGAVHKCFRYKL